MCWLLPRDEIAKGYQRGGPHNHTLNPDPAQSRNTCSSLGYVALSCLSELCVLIVILFPHPILFETGSHIVAKAAFKGATVFLSAMPPPFLSLFFKTGFLCIDLAGLELAL